MDEGDIFRLKTQLDRAMRLCGRKSPSKEDVQFWFDELREFSWHWVQAAFSSWERGVDDRMTPPVPLTIRKACLARSSSAYSIAAVAPISAASQAAYEAWRNHMTFPPEEWLVIARVRCELAETPPEQLPYWRDVAERLERLEAVGRRSAPVAVDGFSQVASAFGGSGAI